MPLASKILVVCVLIVALAFVWLSASVLEARRQWDIKVKLKAGEVAKAEKEVDALINGTDDFRAAFKQDVADPVLKLGSPAANTEFNTKFDAGYDARLAFEAAMNLFVAQTVFDTFQKTINDLNDVQKKAPVPDEIQLEAAVKAFDAAERDVAAALKNLDDAYDIFLGQKGSGGIRGLAGKGMGIDALRQTVEHFRQIIYAQRAVFNIMLSDGQKNETLIRNQWIETAAEANTLEKATANGLLDVENRTKELAELTEMKDEALAALLNEWDKDREKVDLKQTKNKVLVELAEQEAKRDKAIADLADLTMRFHAVKGKTVLLAQKVKELEIRIDARRGIKTAVLTPDGRVPQGKIQKVNDQEGTAEINIGATVGVKSGVQLHVYRFEPEAKYLGIMEIIKYESDSAVGRMLPEYRQLTIQPGDRVSTEITRPSESESN